MESAKESLYGLDYVSGLQLLINIGQRHTILSVEPFCWCYPNCECLVLIAADILMSSSKLSFDWWYLLLTFWYYCSSMVKLWLNFRDDDCMKATAKKESANRTARRSHRNLSDLKSVMLVLMCRRLYFMARTLQTQYYGKRWHFKDDVAFLEDTFPGFNFRANECKSQLLATYYSLSTTLLYGWRL